MSKIRGYIDWVKERPNARIILGGDIFNCATRESKTSPFNQSTSNEDDDTDLDFAIRLFEPVKDKIAAAVIGNHEERLVDYANEDKIRALCTFLKIPYLKYSGVVIFKINQEIDGFYRHNYKIYVHHTTGGGGSQGSAINRVAKLTDIVEGCDAYLGFHSHKLAATPVLKYYPSIKIKDGNLMKRRRVWYVSCGSFLEYPDSYAEMKMLAPQKLGSPKLILSGGKEHEIHVSL